MGPPSRVLSAVQPDAFGKAASSPRCALKRCLAPLVLVALAALAAWGLGTLLTGRNSHAGQAPEREAKAKAFEGWIVHLPEARPGSQTASFNGAYRPGQLLCLPAGAAFTLRPVPAEALGTWTVTGGERAWRDEGGKLEAAGPGEAFTARAPQRPGLYRLRWTGVQAGEGQGELLVLTGRRAEYDERDGRTRLKVNGKYLGGYHDAGKSGLKHVAENAGRYVLPEFFVTLDEETLELPIGGGHVLGQLVGFKDYRGPDGKKVLTTERHTDMLAPNREIFILLAKLKERLEQKGVHFSRFWITSGFRTPDYNHSIGGAAFSRHGYGDAVDLVIDEDGDKKMDDLNHDGRVDRHDGLVIATAALELTREGQITPGGIGVYEWPGDDTVLSHVHLDCRGYPARWGQIGSGPQKRLFDWWTPLGDKGGDGAGD